MVEPKQQSFVFGQDNANKCGDCNFADKSTIEGIVFCDQLTIMPHKLTRACPQFQPRAKAKEGE